MGIRWLWVVVLALILSAAAVAGFLNVASGDSGDAPGRSERL